jgi:hypothetical protein
MPVFMRLGDVKGEGTPDDARSAPAGTIVVPAEEPAPNAAGNDVEFKYLSVRRYGLAEEVAPDAVVADGAGARGDVSGDGKSDIVVGTGGSGAHVRSLEGGDGGDLVVSQSVLPGQPDAADKPDDAGLVVDGVDAAGLDHGVTVLAWARVDGTLPQAADGPTRGTIHIESFSWGASNPTSDGSGGWNEYRVSVDTIEAETPGDAAGDLAAAADAGAVLVGLGDGSVRFVHDGVDPF